MSTVRIESFAGQRLSALINLLPGEAMSVRSSEVIDFCQKMSGEIYAGYVDDKIVCCWGLIPPTLLSNQAYLWMWSTEGIRDHAFLLVRHSQRQVAKMLERYDVIVGHCRIDRPDSIRWLRWLGAEFDAPEGPFRSFRIRKKTTWTLSLSA
jgi:hypothetical protein